MSQRQPHTRIAHIAHSGAFPVIDQHANARGSGRIQAQTGHLLGSRLEIRRNGADAVDFALPEGFERGLWRVIGTEHNTVNQVTLDTFGALAIYGCHPKLNAINLSIRSRQRFDLVWASANRGQVEGVALQVLNRRALKHVGRNNPDPQLIGERGQRVRQPEAHHRIRESIHFDGSPELAQRFRTGEQRVAHQPHGEHDIACRERYPVLPQHIVAQDDDILQAIG